LVEDRAARRLSVEAQLEGLRAHPAEGRQVEDRGARRGCGPLQRQLGLAAGPDEAVSGGCYGLAVETFDERGLGRGRAEEEDVARRPALRERRARREVVDDLLRGGRAAGGGDSQQDNGGVPFQRRERRGRGDRRERIHEASKNGGWGLEEASEHGCKNLRTRRPHALKPRTCGRFRVNRAGLLPSFLCAP